jgi:DNA-directed RNA polymerase specialized sigma24 family protein
MLTDDQLAAARECALRIARRFRLADPEDAAQDAVLEVWRAAERETPERFEPWMRTIIRRRIIDAVRRETARPTESLPEGFGETYDPPMPQVSFARCAEVVGSELVNLMNEGYTLAESAKRTGITVDAIKGRLARSRCGARL